MKNNINIETLLAPIPGDNLAGEDLRYTTVYDNINEARREDILDGLNEGHGKVADWNTVIALTRDALESKTKDLQIAVWLAEALIKTDGIEGFCLGLKIVTGLLKEYWENLYPVMEDGDVDYRVGPLEFLNGKGAYGIKQSPITDAGSTPGYSWYKWDESRHVGYEKDTLNSFGDVDQSKKEHRDELISEGKLTPEEFDSAAEQSSEIYCEELFKLLNACNEEFRLLDETVDEKFGADAPRLAEIRVAIEDCIDLVKGLYRDKLESEDEPLDAEEESSAEGGENEVIDDDMDSSFNTDAGVHIKSGKLSGGESMERSVWDIALKTLKSGGINKAMRQLYDASSSMPSVREKNRYRLMMAKLCLKANRTDLARPIIEELYALIEELNLERWESPMWIAEVLEALYKCLTTGPSADEDIQRAQELFKKICKTDITKAMSFKA